MYRIYERNEAIKDVQKKLIAIHESSTIFPTGIYDEETKRLVQSFQKENGLNITGIVNLDTLDLLDKEANRLKSAKKVRECNRGLSFPIKSGDHYREIYHINDKLIKILDHYKKSHDVRRGTYFGDKSADGVTIARKIYGLKEGDSMDEELYERIIFDLESIQSK